MDVVLDVQTPVPNSSSYGESWPSYTKWMPNSIALEYAYISIH
jgi:hypothetical protein